jgi:hypothetical protein
MMPRRANRELQTCLLVSAAQSGAETQWRRGGAGGPLRWRRWSVTKVGAIAGCVSMGKCTTLPSGTRAFAIALLRAGALRADHVICRNRDDPQGPKASGWGRDLHQRRQRRHPSL